MGNRVIDIGVYLLPDFSCGISGNILSRIAQNQRHSSEVRHQLVIMPGPQVTGFCFNRGKVALSAETVDSLHNNVRVTYIPIGMAPKSGRKPETIVNIVSCNQVTITTRASGKGCPGIISSTDIPQHIVIAIRKRTTVKSVKEKANVFCTDLFRRHCALWLLVELF